MAPIYRSGRKRQRAVFASLNVLSGSYGTYPGTILLKPSVRFHNAIKCRSVTVGKFYEFDSSSFQIIKYTSRRILSPRQLYGSLLVVFANSLPIVYCDQLTVY